jgi:hypothetical protein
MKALLVDLIILRNLSRITSAYVTSTRKYGWESLILKTAFQPSYAFYATGVSAPITTGSKRACAKLIIRHTITTTRQHNHTCIGPTKTGRRIIGKRWLMRCQAMSGGQWGTKKKVMGTTKRLIMVPDPRKEMKCRYQPRPVRTAAFFWYAYVLLTNPDLVDLTLLVLVQ